MHENDRVNPLSQLNLEALTLAECAILFLVLCLPALIQTAGPPTDPQVKQNYIVFSVAPPTVAGGELTVGRDLGIYFRRDGEPDVANNLSERAGGGTGWTVSWPGLNYALLGRKDPDIRLKIGCWLKLDPQRRADPAYLAAIRRPITVYAYNADAAADVQAALVCGLVPNAPLTMSLDPSAGFQVEADLPSSLAEDR